MKQSFSAAKGDGHFLSLLPQEVNHNMYDAATTIITTFEGVLPFEMLQTRARKILTANPWLAARLYTDKQTGKVSLWIPAEPPVSPFYDDEREGRSDCYPLRTAQRCYHGHKE
jgi:hypothetical protein